MKRNLTFEEISDGKLYTKDDLAKISCNDCNGCSECCKVTEDTIFLDPYDIYSLQKSCDSSIFEEVIGFTVVDGVITPFLKKEQDSSECFFLNKEGRCLIHDARPGFCRLFPLGRIWNDAGTFNYFIQVHECPYPNKTKVKIKNWLGIEGIKEYEKFVCDWHEITKNISDAYSEGLDGEALKQVNVKLISLFINTPYDLSKDFYEQFYERVDLFRQNNV